MTSKVYTFLFLSNSKCIIADLILKFYYPNINIILSIIAVEKEIQDIVLDLECKIEMRRKDGALF